MRGKGKPVTSLKGTKVEQKVELLMSNEQNGKDIVSAGAAHASAGAAIASASAAMASAFAANIKTCKAAAH